MLSLFSLKQLLVRTACLLLLAPLLLSTTYATDSEVQEFAFAPLTEADQFYGTYKLTSVGCLKDGKLEKRRLNISLFDDAKGEYLIMTFNENKTGSIKGEHIRGDKRCVRTNEFHYETTEAMGDEPAKLQVNVTNEKDSCIARVNAEYSSRFYYYFDAEAPEGILLMLERPEYDFQCGGTKMAVEVFQKRLLF